MDSFYRDNFLELATVRKPHCISLYIATEKASGGEGFKKNQIRLKNELGSVESKLEDLGIGQREIQEWLQEPRRLVNDTEFLNHLDSCLVFFINENNTKYYRLPLPITTMNYVGDHYYLTPLVNLLVGDYDHYILALSANELQFFEGNRFDIKPHNISELIPANKYDVVGSDYEQASLQFRSGHGEPGDAAIYHGQGAGSESEKELELTKYFREIDKGILEALEGKSAYHLILACVDHLFDLYKTINSNNHLLPENISGNPEHKHMTSLHEQAIELLKNRNLMALHKKWQEYEDKLPDAEASFNFKEVLRASLSGRTDTIFIKKDEQIWGKYDPTLHELITGKQSDPGSVDLVNLAVTETIKNGGKAYVWEEEDFKATASGVVAIFRYAYG